MAVALLVTMLSVFAIPVLAEETAGANADEYIECSFDETSKTVVQNAKKIPADAIKIEGSYNSITLEAGKWYVVSGTATAATITVNGTKDSPTNLILKDGCTLTVNGTVAVIESHFLNIYGQKENAGVLSATSDNGAGIGGLIPVSDKNCGNVTIHGGTVNAVSNAMQGAGIGGAGTGGNGGVVTVYGGLVNATGNDMPAIAGSLHLPDSAIIMAGDDKDSTGPAETYNNYPFVQIHFHNAETLKKISENQHGCPFCEKEYVPNGNIDITGLGNYYIKAGEYTVDAFNSGKDLSGDITLTIDKGAVVTVTGNLENYGTLHVYGTLIVKGTANNYGKIHVGCSGEFEGEIYNNNDSEVVRDNHVFDANGVCENCQFADEAVHKHTWQNGKCTSCGYECKNDFHSGVYKCPDCGLKIEPTAENVKFEGSILSEGSLTIIVGVACLAVGALGMYLIMKKKKPAASDE